MKRKGIKKYFTYHASLSIFPFDLQSNRISIDVFFKNGSIVYCTMCIAVKSVGFADCSGSTEIIYI